MTPILVCIGLNVTRNRFDQFDQFSYKSSLVSEANKGNKEPQASNCTLKALSRLEISETVYDLPLD